MKKYSVSLIVATLLMLVAVSVPLVMPVGAQGRAVFGWVVADTLTVRNLAVIQSGGLTVSAGDVSLSGTTTAGNITADDVNFNNLDVSSSTSTRVLDFNSSEVVTLTNNLVWEPEEAYTPILSTGSITVQLSACDAGRLIVIVNTVNQTITFSDTAPAILSGSTALGQYDSLTLMGDGTRCIEIAQVDN
jgi:hypothetical protein